MIILLTTKHGVEVWVLNVSEGDVRTALSHNAILSAALRIDADTTLSEVLNAVV